VCFLHDFWNLIVTNIFKKKKKKKMQYPTLRDRSVSRTQEPLVLLHNLVLQICILKSVMFLILFFNSAWSSYCNWWLNMDLAQLVWTSHSPKSVITLRVEVGGGGNVPYPKQTNWNLVYFLSPGGYPPTVREGGGAFVYLPHFSC